MHVDEQVRQSTDAAPAPADESLADASPAEVAQAWLAALESALGAGDDQATRGLFVEDAYWRDLVALTWTIGQTHGGQAVAAGLVAAAGRNGFGGLRIAAGRSAPVRRERHHRAVVEAFFDFDTQAGTGTGLVRLVEDAGAPGGARAWLLLTTLQSLKGAGRRLEGARAQRYGYVQASPTETYAGYLARKHAFEDGEPEVLVIGAGHAGLMVAAQLEQLGVDTLLVDRLPRVGDVWRRRPDALALHNPTPLLHFPLMPYPRTFPPFLSKDKLADWLEFYARAMDLSVWTDTLFTHGEYDAQAGRWTAVVRRGDGAERTLRPQHVVMAIGAFGGIPDIPDLPGLADFGGQVLHTADFTSGKPFAGQRALVVGVGTSAHDAAADLHAHGARVTMLQRSPVTVIDMPTLQRSLASAYPRGVPIEELDLIEAGSFVFPLARDLVRETARQTCAEDDALLGKLRRAGLRVDMGPDEGGWQLRAWRTGAGYYINVGGSELIADGQVGVVQSADVDAFDHEGLRLADGRRLDFDVVVLATGYKNLQVDVARLLGQDVAERVGPVFRLDDFGSGEWSNAWTPTPQPGLWFSVGGFLQARPYSLYLALQIAARLRGLVPAEPAR